MAEEEVGGFFVNLKMLTDDASFSRGTEGIKNITDGLTGLIEKGLAIAGVTLGIKDLIETAAAQGQMLITAQQANMSADALANWEGVLNHVGGSMSAFTTAASTMNQEFEKMSFGGKAPADDFFLAIAQLGLSPEALKGEDQNKRMNDIMNAALNYKGPGGKDYARILVRQLGGGMPGLESIFDYLQLPSKDRNGATFASLQAKSSQEDFMNDSARGGAERGSAALRDLTTSLDSIKARLASDIMGALAPDIENLNKWLDAHKDDINNLLNGIAELTKTIVELIGFLPAEAAKAGKPAIPYLQGLDSPSDTGFKKFLDAVTVRNPVFNFLANTGYDIMKALGIKSSLDIKFTVDAKGKETVTATGKGTDGSTFVLTQSGLALQKQ